MEIKLEGRQVELGDELCERIRNRMTSMDQRFGPITHARLSVERSVRKIEQRAKVTAVVHISGTTVTVTKETPTVVAAVNEALETLSLELAEHVEKTKKSHRD
ncbi:HPF/RaiA family ribosome-associated protein [Candidatus Magnetaquicoccus inordinatus]|uniref:HPF/RaiA family ribosome-associated protein n=1 Tax=Candidatus Magnetaquicoccus inordinatus TaxID=2496818 RepID=UPI00102D146A|nr:HPF/RaiA family ribosome-associated protein [Candidatus Magnetaquicoccus inordinatus]